MTLMTGCIAAARGASARALLLILLLAVASCSSSGGGSSDSKKDSTSSAGGDGGCGVGSAPYLTATPTITPTTGAIGAVNNFNVSLTAAGDGDITDVLVWLYGIDYGPDSGTASIAAAGTLTKDATDTTQWAGPLDDSYGEAGLTAAGLHYLWIVLSNADTTYTQYWHDTSQSDTKYYCFQLDVSGGELSYDDGLSDIDLVTVQMN